MIDKQYVLFDLDGTLTDPKVGITKSVQYALRHFNIQVQDLDQLTPFIGPPLRESFRTCYGFDDKQTALAVTLYREYFTVYGQYENILYPGVDTMLHDLREHNKIMILATSKPIFYARNILRHFHINHYFSFLSGAYMDGRRTNKAQVIAYAIKAVPILRPEQAIMIGDRKHDIIGAKETGIQSIGVLYGYGSQEELSMSGADYIAPDIDSLRHLLLCF